MAEASLNLRLALDTAPPQQEHMEGAGRQTRRPAIDVAFIRDLTALKAIAPEWQELEAQATQHRGVFQSFGWVSTWAAAYGEATQPVIVTARRNGRLTMVWPMMAATSGPVSLLRWLTEPFSQYGDILIAPGEDVGQYMESALEAIRQARIADSIRLRHVRADAAIAPWLAGHFRDARFTEQAPFLDLTAFKDEAAYDARYSSTQRKRRKKIRKALEDDIGPVRFTLLRGRDCGPAIAKAIALKSDWIEARGRQNRILRCPRIVGFLSALGEHATPGFELVVSEMTAGDRSVSWEIGLRANGVHYAFITSHAGDLTDYSAARLHMDLSQRQALKDGMTAFDLMIPHDAYKDSWSSAATEAHDYHLPLTPKGQIYGRLYLEALRPVLRDSYYRMPPGLLKLLKPVIGH